MSSGGDELTSSAVEPFYSSGIPRGGEVWQARPASVPCVPNLPPQSSEVRCLSAPGRKLSNRTKLPKAKSAFVVSFLTLIAKQNRFERNVTALGRILTSLGQLGKRASNYPAARGVFTTLGC